MNIFDTMLKNHPVHSGLIFITLGIILLMLRLDSDNKKSYTDRGVLDKTSVINSWGIIAFLILGGIILVLR